MVFKAYLVAFLGGAVSVTSPCTFPLLPPLVAYLAATYFVDRQNQINRLFARTFTRLILIMAGITLIFAFYADAQTAGGAFIHQYKEILTRSSGIIMILAGLVLFWRSTSLSFLSRWYFIIPLAMIIGLIFGLAAIPCCLGRIISAILMTKAAVGRNLLLLGYMLGLSIAFTLISGIILMFAKRYLFAYADSLRLVAGLVLLIMGALLISGWWSYYLFELARYSVTTKTLPVRIEEWLIEIFGMY